MSGSALMTLQEFLEKARDDTEVDNASSQSSVLSDESQWVIVTDYDVDACTKCGDVVWYVVITRASPDTY